MKRLLALPCLFAAGIAYGWWSGYVWPVAGQAALYVKRRPVTAETEGDGIG